MKNISQYNFIANTLRLVFGNIGAQVINLLTIPVITRLYGPESYGVLTLFLSVSTLIIAVSSLRLETVILLPEKKEDAFKVFFLCLLLVSIFSLLIFSFALTLNYTFLQLPESYKTLTPYLYLLAVYIFLAGTYQALSFITVRNNQFTIQAVSRVSNAGVGKLFSIFYGLFLMDNPVGLVSGLIFGNIISCCLIVKYSLNELFFFLRSVQIKSLINIFKRYRSFVIYSGTALLESISRELVPLMLGFLFVDPSIVGFVGLTKRVIQQPLGVLGDAVSRSFFQKITELHRSSQQYDTHVFDLFKYLFIISFIPILLFSLIAPEIFEIIFGVEWRTAGVYFSILSISFFSVFLYRPFSIIFDIQEKQRLRFFLNLFRLLFNVIAIYCGAYLLHSPVYAIILYSATNTIITFSMMFLLMNMSGVTYISLFTIVIKQIFVGLLLMLLVIFYMNFYINQNTITLCAIIGTLITGYYVYIIMYEPKFKMLFKPLIEKFKK